MLNGHPSKDHNGTTRPADLPIVSPDSVALRARDHLNDCAYAELRHVTCVHDHGVLWLEGRVASYFLKQVAQELVRRAEGVESVVNQLEVVDPN